MYHVQDFDIHIATFKAITVFPGINSCSNNPPPPKRCTLHRLYMYICNIKQVPLVNKLSQSPEGWRYSEYQVMGMIEWGQKSKLKEIPGVSNKTPQKIPGPKINPPKIPCQISKP